MVHPQVDADWHAFLPGHFPGSRRTRVGDRDIHQNMHQTVKSKKPGERKKAKVLCAMKEAKDSR